MTKGICLVCKARTDVTKHHVKEIPKKPDGTYESIKPNAQKTLTKFSVRA